MLGHPSYGETFADAVQIQFDPAFAEADAAMLSVE
jgi:hypothetical protein